MVLCIRYEHVFHPVRKTPPIRYCSILYLMIKFLVSFLDHTSQQVFVNFFFLFLFFFKSLIHDVLVVLCSFLDFVFWCKVHLLWLQDILVPCLHIF